MKKKSLYKLVLTGGLLTAAVAAVTIPAVTINTTSQSQTDEIKDSSINDNISSSVNNNSGSDNVNSNISNSAQESSSSLEVKNTKPEADAPSSEDTNVQPAKLDFAPQYIGTDTSKWILTVPENMKYSQTISYDVVENTNQLNSYLLNYFNTDYISANGLEHLSVNLVKDSASYENATFKVWLTPETNWHWNDGTTGSRITEVSLPNLLKRAKDAVYVSSGDSYKPVISIEQVWNNKTFDQYLTSNFKTDELNKWGSYKNVSVTYVKGSANYDNNQFKVLITPLKGHSFANGSSTAVETVISANLNKDFDNYYWIYYSWVGDVGSNFNNIPYIVIDSNSNSYVTYRVFNWQFAPSVVANLSSWKTYWSASTDGGKTWGVVGQGSTVTVNKSLIPQSGLWLRYEIIVEETPVYIYGPPVISAKILYKSNAIKVLD